MTDTFLPRVLGKIILASASPRRAQILKQVGFDFDVMPSAIEEVSEHHEPVEYAREIAQKKALDIAQKYPERIVIAADTIVCLDGHILGKPSDEEDAWRMLRFLSGRNHQVYTAFAISHRSRNVNMVEHELTQVHFRRLRDEEIAMYIATGAPFDKAGAYGIQDASAIFVDRIDGDFYNVVGLPVTRLYQVLTDTYLEKR
ncbi:MAG TPA: Maf family protein [bacterium]|nr:Maf family protein [bacterium]HMY35107.1 Maf family protein [bacterium]HMZ05792.1 Maf family protein [bacterium]HNB10830.1 Maf family protein [bacterium]HND76252.1 Maf family protein [bacterium]